MAAPANPPAKEKRKPHPIIDVVFRCLVKGAEGSKERLRLDEAVAAKALGASFRAMKDEEERENALLELVAWSQFMAMTGTPSVMTSLKTLLAPIFGVEAGSGSVAMPATEAGKKALKFLGIDNPAAKAMAPKAGAAPGKKWWEIDR
jgi:hypothetical protein